MYVLSFIAKAMLISGCLDAYIKPIQVMQWYYETPGMCDL